MLFSTTTFAKDDVSAKIKTEFQKNFTSATAVQWKKMQGIFVATFKDNGQDLSAAYNEEGELLGASRYINADQLPLNVSIALRNMPGQYHICNSVLELTTDGQTTYCVTGENEEIPYRNEGK